MVSIDQVLLVYSGFTTRRINMIHEKYLHSSKSLHYSISVPKHYIHQGSLGRWLNIDGLMQKRHNSIALEMELRFSCIKPSLSSLISQYDIQKIFCQNWKVFNQENTLQFMIHKVANFHEMTYPAPEAAVCMAMPEGWLSADTPTLLGYLYTGKTNANSLLKSTVYHLYHHVALIVLLQIGRLTNECSVLDDNLHFVKVSNLFIYKDNLDINNRNFGENWVHYKQTRLNHLWTSRAYIDGLVQERCNSIVNALELHFLALTHRHDIKFVIYNHKPRVVWM